MSKIVVVGCKLPHGLVLAHPMDASKTVTLKGVNEELIAGSGYGLTDVDAEFWEQWEATNRDFAPMRAKAIFVAKNATDAPKVAEELKNETTGLEPLRTDGKDKRASGVKTADKKDD